MTNYAPVEPDNLIYLACPYSDPDYAVMHKRFKQVCEAASIFMKQGMVIFSPIAHCHPVAEYGLPRDWGFWERYDTVFIDKSDELWVLMLPGWEDSVGLQNEIRIFQNLGKPIRMIDPQEIGIEI